MVMVDSSPRGLLGWRRPGPPHPSPARTVCRWPSRAGSQYLSIVVSWYRTHTVILTESLHPPDDRPRKNDHP